MNDYRVVLIDNPDISPFPCHRWPTHQLADAFCESADAGEWNGKLQVVNLSKPE